MAQKTRNQMRGEKEPYGDWLENGREAMKKRILKDCPKCEAVRKYAERLRVDGTPIELGIAKDLMRLTEEVKGEQA